MTSGLLNNRYQIIQTLGSGGFGETFLAEDTQMPSHRRCVIKQLKPVNNNPQIYQLIKQRFQREAAVLENCGENNSQIPKLYAYFEINEQFYLVQELITGVTLKQLVQQQGILNENTVREILISLLSVLDYIHNKRIVHRDIKPDNIIWRSRDHLPVLIDFGAVRETMATMVSMGGNDASSIIIGTPGFMPSEQSAGRPVYSSDLYSLGLTAIYLLTGKFPQELETDYQSGAILWRDYATNINPSFVNVLDKAIQTHPRDRYTTARAMLKDLEVTPTTIPNHIPSSQQQTVVVSPQQVQQTNSPNYPKSPNNNSFVMGGAIAASIIVIGVIMGLFLNKQSLTSIAPKTSSSRLLAQVIPNYIAATFSPENAFTTCPENTKLYLVGETQNFRFAVCGENRQPLYYRGLDKNRGVGIRLRWAGDGFRNGEYLYEPPSYDSTNTQNVYLRVSVRNKIIVNEAVTQMYKLE